jgi:TolA-binding protein
MKNDSSNIFIAALLVGLASLPLVFSAKAKHKTQKVDDTDVLMHSTMEKLHRMKEVSSRVNQTASAEVSTMRTNIKQLQNEVVQVNKVLQETESKNKYYELTLVKMDSVVRGSNVGEPFTVLAIEAISDTANRK